VGTGVGVLEGGRRRLHLAGRELAHGGDDGRGRGGERSDHEDLAYALQGRLVTSLTNGATRLQEPMGAEPVDDERGSVHILLAMAPAKGREPDSQFMSPLAGARVQAGDAP